MPAHSSKSDEIARECEIDNLAATISEQSVNARMAGFNLIDMSGVIALTEQMPFPLNDLGLSVHHALADLTLRERHQLHASVGRWCGYCLDGLHDVLSRLLRSINF